MDAAENTALLAPADVTPETKLSQVYESQGCTRCGGSGRYSFNLMHGDRCYGCGGTGVKLTKRGAATKAFAERLVEVTAETLTVGDVIWEAGTPMSRAGWAEVVEIELEADRSDVGGAIYTAEELGEKVAKAAAEGPIRVEPYHGRFVLKSGRRIEVQMRKGGDSVSYRSVPNAKVFRAAIDRNVRTAVAKTAAEYQETLTKAGTPRKGTRWA